MTDTKRDSSPRVGWKEAVKRRIVQQFDAALCGGIPHRSYLEELGMLPDRIFDGCDVVDNEYFEQGADKVRQAPDRYRPVVGLGSGQPFFLASARFIKRKNINGLLRAYASYRLGLKCRGEAEHPWGLVILGGGAERDALESVVRSEGIQGVCFAGFRQIDQLPVYYGLAGAFIHPALQDEWGLVVNEAMAAGLPVIVSNRCGCAPDLVLENKNGFTFDPQDVGKLAHLMTLFSSGRVDARAMGVASREHIKGWGLERFVHGLWGSLQAALRSRLDAGINSVRYAKVGL